MKKSIDPVWEQVHSSRDWGQYPSEHIIRFVARNYYKENRDNIKILDFGCGGGAHTWYLAREGFDTYAFDGSKSAVMKTEQKLQREGLIAQIRVMDGKELDYSSSFFNAVIDSACICSNPLDDIRDMYRSIYRVLMPGGKILTTAFTTATTGFGDGDLIEPGTYTNIRTGALAGLGVAHFWEDGELEKLLYEIGFQKLQADYNTYTSQGSTVSLIIISGVK